MGERHPTKAYQVWVCPTCNGEMVYESAQHWDLRCETCGWTFVVSGMSAYYVHTDEDEPGCCEEEK